MRKILIFLSLCSVFAAKAQSWSLTGNTGISPELNFLGTIDSKDLIFKTDNIERLRINSVGGIGIGGAPVLNSALQVYGRTQVVTNMNADSFFIGNNNTNIDNGVDLAFLRYGSYQPNNPGVITVAGYTSPTKYEAFFTLRANGKLGLGTVNVDCVNCDGYRLLVKDGIKTEKVKVEIAAENGWADYVFHKNYKLMPLKEVERYININGHLPEVPTTEEAIANGIELKEMNILLLKKVEELTLHMIDLNKKLENLENKNKN